VLWLTLPPNVDLTGLVDLSGLVYWSVVMGYYSFILPHQAAKVKVERDRGIRRGLSKSFWGSLRVPDDATASFLRAENGMYCHAERSEASQPMRGRDSSLRSE